MLRALDCVYRAGGSYDTPLDDALDILRRKRRKDYTWPFHARRPGQTHFDMEETGGSGRGNTWRVLRVLQHFGE
jgi:hypothetical protein